MSVDPAGSKLLAVRRAIETGLTAAGIVREVKPFAQLIEAQDLKQIGIASPGAFVAITSAPSSEPLAPGDMRITLRCAVAIACTPKPALTNDEHALVVAEAVLLWAGWKTWGVSGCGPVQRRRLEILPVPGRVGVALQAVIWEQTLRLGAPFPDPEGVDESLRPETTPELTLNGDEQ